jgi:hypothetical protein
MALPLAATGATGDARGMPAGATRDSGWVPTGTSGDAGRMATRASRDAGGMTAAHRDAQAHLAAAGLGLGHLLLIDRAHVLAELGLQLKVRTSVRVAHVVSHEKSFSSRGTVVFAQTSVQEARRARQ